ncbi:hypothetical protein D8B45_07875 [Candidatus Gracilibacteria bacterium]|nr:MAG: hypothetical protein D8B45_07875 [Candidatus Gracilibacteria bacterium]
MKLYIKTPFVNNNKFIPHLLEHCALQSRDPGEYLKYSISTNASTSTGFSCFEREDIPAQEFFDYLRMPLKEEIFNQELLAIAKELENPSFGQKVYEKILNQISSEKITTNKVQEISLTQLQDYHNQRYQEEYTLLIDKDGKIDKNWGMGKQIKHQQLDIKNLTKVNCGSFSYRKQLQHFLWTKYSGIEDIFVLDYIGDLLESYWIFDASLHSKYFYSSFDWSFGDQYMILSHSGTLEGIKKSDFFTFSSVFKENYLRNLDYGWYRAWDSHIALFMGLETSIEEHKKLVKSIDNRLIESIVSDFLGEKFF